MRRAGIDVVLVPAAWALDLLVWAGATQMHGGGTVPWWVVPVTSAIAFATLLTRRDRPAAALAVQLIWSLGGTAVLPGYAPVAGVLIALYNLAARRGPGHSVPGLLAYAAPVALQAYSVTHSDPGAELAVSVNAWLLPALAATAAWSLGHLTRNGEIRAAQVAAIAEALRNERLRIARELHDIVAHSVSVMVLQAAGARAVLARDPDRADAALRVIQDSGTQSLSELRRLLELLRSASGDDGMPGPDRQPGIGDIPALLDSARAAGLTVTTETEGTPGRVDPSVGLAAYRLVQESLTNAMKHAGAGAQVRIHRIWGDEQLSVEVRSWGTATPSKGLSMGYGLLGLRERVSTVGGTFEAGPVSTGFRVRAVLPLVRQPAPSTAATVGNEAS